MNAAIGPGVPEESLREAGNQPLPVGDLLRRILEHTVWGDFLHGYRFVSYCGQDGSIEGTNNAGSYNTGRWEADPLAGTFSVSWNQSWVPATLRSYDIGGKLHFFDVRTRTWHMSIDRIIAGRQPLQV